LEILVAFVFKGQKKPFFGVPEVTKIISGNDLQVRLPAKHPFGP